MPYNYLLLYIDDAYTFHVDTSYVANKFFGGFCILKFLPTMPHGFQ